MTFPDLPAQGASSWYAWASGLDTTVRTAVQPADLDAELLAGVVVLGSEDTPLSDASTARPVGANIVYWLMAFGVSPVNAIGPDLIWNAPA